MINKEIVAFLKRNDAFFCFFISFFYLNTSVVAGFNICTCFIDKLLCTFKNFLQCIKLILRNIAGFSTCYKLFIIACREILIENRSKFFKPLNLFYSISIPTVTLTLICEARSFPRITI